MAFAAGPQLGGRWRPAGVQGTAAAARRCRAPGAQRRTLAVRAAGGASGSARTIELPIFPLNVVALPHATVPLMIFEPR